MEQDTVEMANSLLASGRSTGAATAGPGPKQTGGGTNASSRLSRAFHALQRRSNDHVRDTSAHAPPDQGTDPGVAPSAAWGGAGTAGGGLPAFCTAYVTAAST